MEKLGEVVLLEKFRLKDGPATIGPVFQFLRMEQILM